MRKQLERLIIQFTSHYNHVTSVITYLMHHRLHRCRRRRLHNTIVNNHILCCCRLESADLAANVFFQLQSLSREFYNAVKRNESSPFPILRVKPFLIVTPKQYATYR